jgi:putative transposase
MWDELDRERVARENRIFAVHRSRKEVEEIVVMLRLNLYNRGLPCGPKALRLRLEEKEALRPLPSERTIARILVRNGLTHGRTGFYDADGAK